MRLLFLVCLAVAGVALLLSGCAASATEDRGALTPPGKEPRRAPLPVLRQTAPELTNTVWLNTDSPLRLAHLRGRVVLVDFWTFG